LQTQQSGKRRQKLLLSPLTTDEILIHTQIITIYLELRIMKPDRLSLIFGWLLLSLVPLTANAQAQKPNASAKPTIVIVHGAWGGAWAFRHVDELLRDKGFNVYRPQLTGQGDRVHLARPEIGLSTHIEDVVNTILYEDLHDIILVGHSYGGMVITGVADRVPERIKRLVYLDALLPSDGESVMTIFKQNDFVKSMIKGDFIVPPWVKPDQPPPHDVPQSLKTFTEPISLKNKAARELRATYILTVDKGKEAKDDDFFSQSQRAKERGWPVLQLTADHNAQWSAPEALVEMLAHIQ
jgi:pimeloyl-ACP methyl ester carboxylesterase